MLQKKVIISMLILCIIGVLVGSFFYFDQQKRQPRSSVIMQEAQVDEVEIFILESFPVQVHVIARGELPDSCTEIDEVSIRREGDIFYITITTTRPFDKGAPVVTPFEEVIPLDVIGLKAGIYTVNVNGVIDTFEFQVDNILKTLEAYSFLDYHPV